MLRDLLGAEVKSAHDMTPDMPGWTCVVLDEVENCSLKKIFSLLRRAVLLHLLVFSFSHLRI